MSGFSTRLYSAVQEKKTPVLVGLDPRASMLPEGMLPEGPDASFEARAAAYRQFCCEVVDVVAPLVPAVKPQVAFFEQLGPAGMVALADVIRYARAKGLLVIVDGKRNDIGSTAEAYADGFLSGANSAWQGDALTVSPYLGADSLDPFVDVCRNAGSGIFVLVKTSNPGGGMLQDLEADGKPIYEYVADYVESIAAETSEACGYGAVGAVVGATYPEQLDRLRSKMPHAWLLVPGFGSQGGTAKGVAGAFDENGFGAIVNNSRGILFAFSRDPYKSRFGAARWQDALQAATVDMIDQLHADTSAGRLA
jgi:orotidine-5'-phosphate decarboxylase